MDATRNNDPVVLLAGYNLALGDKRIVKKMSKSCRWSVQTILDGLAGGLDATVTIKQSNVEPVGAGNISDYYGGLFVTLDADGSKSMEDEMFTHEWMVIEIAVNAATGGILQLILQLDGNSSNF